MTDDEDDFYTTSFSTEDQEPNESTVVKNSQINNKEENVYSNGEQGNIYDAVVAIKEGHANIAYKEEKDGEKVAVKNNSVSGNQPLDDHQEEDNLESMNPFMR